jgi:hypothetical protein
MTRAEVALHIFLKRMPTEPLTEKTMGGYASSMEQSFEIADLFLEKANSETNKRVQSELDMANEAIRKRKEDNED